MQDLWRLSATDIAALIRSKKVSAKEAAHGRAGAARCGQPHDQRRGRSSAGGGAGAGRGRSMRRSRAARRSVRWRACRSPSRSISISRGSPPPTASRLQRDVIAQSNSPVIDNLRKAGAVILGRTNCPAFSYRWFTTNLIHGDTKNPRDPGITPGGSSGGAGAAVAAGIGHIAHGTDIAGSIRYPAYACGVHGLRPTVGRIAAFNAALPERTIGPQISAVSGPLARTIGDLRIALAAMSGKDVRDPWWVPAPLEGPAMPKRAALCLQPDGLETSAEVKAAVADAGKRLERAGWMVEEVATPPLREAADLQTKLWLGDGYEAQLAAAEREGDPGALACLRGNRAKVFPFDAAAFSKALTRRATLTREWLQFFETYSVLLIPVSGELPFPDGLDMRDEASFARVWRAQLTQIAIPFMGLPALTVSTGLVGRVPVGVQVVSGRLPRGSLLARGRGDRGGRNAGRADRSRPVVFEAKEHDGWHQRFHGKVACRRGRIPEAVRGSGAPDRQHRERLRVHAAIQRPRGAAPGTLPARLFGARISLQPVRRPGTRRRQGDRTVLRQQLCRHLSDVRQDRRQRRQCASAVSIFEERKIRAARLVDQMEFHQIPGRSFGQGGGAACADRHAGRSDKKEIEALL